MITDSSVEIDAPPDVVWAVFSDVEQWPGWTDSVDRLVALDGPELAIGRRFEIRQPKLPKLIWTVSALERGVSWTWEQRTPGGHTLATHWVDALGHDRTLVRQRIDQRGPLGTLVGLVMRRLTRRYLEMEGAGLKARSEAGRSAPPT
jgi:ligand-binding SRPBCC domain-containing protein